MFEEFSDLPIIYKYNLCYSFISRAATKIGLLAQVVYNVNLVLDRW